MRRLERPRRAPLPLTQRAAGGREPAAPEGGLRLAFLLQGASGGAPARPPCAPAPCPAAAAAPLPARRPAGCRPSRFTEPGQIWARTKLRCCAASEKPLTARRPGAATPWSQCPASCGLQTDPPGPAGASRAGAGQGDKAERNWAGSRGPSASLKAGGPRLGCPSWEGPGAGRSRRAWHAEAPGRCFWNEGLNHRKADTAQPSGRPELRSCCSKASWRGPWGPAHQTQGPFSVPKEAQRPEGQASTVPGLTAAPRTPGPGTCQHRLPAVSASGPADLCPRHRHSPAKVPAGDPAPQCGRGSSHHHLYPPIPHEPRA